MRDRPNLSLPVPGLWLVWDPGVVWRFIQQTTASFERWRYPSLRERRQRYKLIRPMQQAYARELGITEMAGRRRTVTCPTCGNAGACWLELNDGRWLCARCDGPQRQRYRHVPDALHLRLSRYQFALILGAAGSAIERRRQQVIKMLRSRMLVPRELSARELWLMMVGSVLLEIPPYWRLQIPMGRYSPLERFQPGRFYQTVVGCLMPALIEHYLRPDVYARRYYRMLEGA